MPKARYTRDRERGGYRFNFRQANGKYTTLRAATVPEMDNLIRQKTKEREAQQAATPNGVTVADVTAKWMPVACAELAYRSREAIEYAAGKVVTMLGDKDIAALRPSDVDNIMLSMSGMSSSAKEKVLRTLRRVCTYAQENGWIQDDPTAGKTAGGSKPAEVHALTAEQQDTLLSAVKGTRAYLFVLLCLRAGLRREEALGLKWDCVHLDSPAWIEVRGTVTFHYTEGVYQDTTKTPAARRRIPIPDDLRDALEDAQCKSTSPFVIHSADGKPCTRQSFRSMWDLVTRRQTSRSGERHLAPLTLDFDVHPHQLRHTYISELCAHSAETGLDIKTIQYLAGHTSPVTTLKIYAHVMAENQDATAEKIQKIFAKSSPISSP